MRTRHAGLDPAVVAIAWKAQHRLHHRYRQMTARGKRHNQIFRQGNLQCIPPPSLLESYLVQWILKLKPVVPTVMTSKSCIGTFFPGP